MIKTQHCPNCEATEQKLHDFRQEVSDALLRYFAPSHVPHGLKSLIIPKPDPLVEALNESGVILAGPVAKDLRAALEARGLEIREKNDG